MFDPSFCLLICIKFDFVNLVSVGEKRNIHVKITFY